jgi:hypothetical protein
MAKILNFRPVELRREAGEAPAARASAQVIVFPGVRYERWDSDEPAARPQSTPRKRGQRRDVLELAE